MGLNRKVGFFQGLKYQGGGPMIAWMLHRISGIAIVIFVGLHIIASFSMQQLAGDIGTAINIVYENWVFQIFVAFFVIFHALNGLRIVIQDIWPKLQMYQRSLIYLQLAVFIAVYGLTTALLIYINLSG